MALNDPTGNAMGRWLELTVLRGLMKLSRVEWTGFDNIPRTGPLIFIINHIAFQDPVMILGSLPRRTIPFAKVEAFDSGIWSFLMRVYGTIPVRRGEVDMGAIKSALRILKNGGAILLAPEGTRSRNYQLQPGKDGATILALRSGAPIVPIGVTGTHRIVAHFKQLKRPPVHFSVGKPFCLRRRDTGNRRPTREEISGMTREAMYRLAAQLPPEFRGVYRDVDDVTFQHAVPSEG
jgi:1-acyl-sn-glycerol-3-phosphate acyltransferase